MRRVQHIAVVSLCLFAGPALADEPTTDETFVNQARELVAQLASTNYAKRQAATDQLARLGPPARTALEEGLKSPQLETRLRVRRILSLIQQGEFERTIADFLADVDDARVFNLPTWPRFREVVGSDAAARTTFVAMLRAEGDLLSAVEKNPRTAATTFQMRLQQLQVGSASQQSELDSASLAAVLFVASDERVPNVNGNDSLLYRFCSHSRVEQVLETNDQQSIIRKLVGTWIASSRGGYYGLRLAMQYDLAEGLPAAEKMLADDTPSYYRQYAILTFAKLGSKEHIPRLKKLLADATVCTTHRVDDETYQTQYRDIALVVILHLYGQDPKEFGFERAREHSQYVYAPYTLGFKNDEERQSRWTNGKPSGGRCRISLAVIRHGHGRSWNLSSRADVTRRSRWRDPTASRACSTDRRRAWG